MPKQEGRELGRAGRSAPAGRGSGVSCRVQWGFQQPMVGLLSSSTARSQPHLAWGRGWGNFPSCLLSLMDVSHCFVSSWIFPSLLPPGPWESIPAFHIPPSLSAKYYIQGFSVYPGSCHPHIPTATQWDQNLPQGKGRTGRISSCFQGLQPTPWLQILTGANSSCIFHLCSRNALSPFMGAPSAHALQDPIPRAAGNNVMSCLFPPSHEV